jgi:predicted transcriptional regulator
MTVMNRLVEKGHLRRARSGAVFYYTPTADRTASAARAARDSLAALVRAYGNAAVAGFVDALDNVNPRLLSELKRRIAR